MELPDPGNPVIPANRTHPAGAAGGASTAATLGQGNPAVGPAAATDEPPIFLTAREVGQQLGIRKSRVYELAAAGLLPVVRLGRRMRFPRRGLEELAAAAIERTKAEVLGAGGVPVPVAQTAALRRRATYRRSSAAGARHRGRRVA
jgi:excisionase family DNA binding protein